MLVSRAKTWSSLALGFLMVAGAVGCGSDNNSNTLCGKMVQCGVVPSEAICEQYVPILAPFIPDPVYFANCMVQHPCSDYADLTTLQATIKTCDDVDPDTSVTYCTNGGSTLHVCCKTTHNCTDVSCATGCSLMGRTAVGCGFDSSPQYGYNVCKCQ